MGEIMLIDGATENKCKVTKYMTESKLRHNVKLQTDDKQKMEDGCMHRQTYIMSEAVTS